MFFKKLLLAVCTAVASFDCSADIVQNTANTACVKNCIIRPRIAVMGDSIAQLNSTQTTLAPAYSTQGWLTWAQARLGWPWYFPIANNFAVFGTTTTVILANQLPTVLASHAVHPISRIFITAGTNDAGSSIPLATTEANLASMFSQLKAAGIIPVYIAQLPRGSDVSLTTQKQNLLALNEWAYWYMTTEGGMEFIDCSDALVDNSTAFFNPILTLMDGPSAYLHPRDLGSWYMGKIIAAYYTAKGIAGSNHFAKNLGDYWSASNPSGYVLSSANVMMAGAGDFATSGGTWVAGTRTLDNGQTRKIWTDTLAASTTHYMYDDVLGPAASAWDGTKGVLSGLYVYGIAQFTLTNVTNITTIQLQVNENDGSGNGLNSGGVIYGGSYAMNWSYNTNASAPDSPLTLTLMTPPILVRPYYGTGQPSIFVKLGWTTGAGGSGSIQVNALDVRLWDGEL